MRQKRVYFFGNGKADGSESQRAILGGKGAGLAEMTNIGIPVPPGFTISAQVCLEYLKDEGRMPEGLEEEVLSNLARVEEVLGKKYGDQAKPLLLSIRSGAAVSMPGMMDTVLNLGLNDKSVVGLARTSGDERFAYDSYRRLIQMYSDVVIGIEHHKFEDTLREAKEKKKVALDLELKSEDLKEVVNRYNDLVRKETGSDFPSSPLDQLWGGIGAVFKSWNTKRAIEYRRLNRIPEDMGTGVNIQAMVFGNMGARSATGVAFTRDPSTGENRFYGEFLPNAQGEDVVAGIRTPQPLSRTDGSRKGVVSLEEMMPGIYQELVDIFGKLELHYHDMQDVEFTIEEGKLWILQTRSGKRTGKAAMKIAVDMVGEGLLDRKEAILSVEPASADQLLHPMIDPKAAPLVLAKGLPASPGAASGMVVFHADDARDLGQKHDVILVRAETSPDDIHGMAAARGILTSTGGMTSHAAIVARGMGKPCVVGCDGIRVDVEAGVFAAKGKQVKKGELITIDGSTGRVMHGKIPTIPPELTPEFTTLMTWADECRTLGVRANADTPIDARTARKFGAEGIGLCRTEHMFFESNRIDAMREMILAHDREGRRKALDKILPMQRHDFEEIFKEMKGLPVTIRLLDPPLHEFLPKTDEEFAHLSAIIGIDVAELGKIADSMREANPMLGHRGCRLGITFPEITEMQATAIFEAAVNVAKGGGDPKPEIMVPLTANEREFLDQKNIIVKIGNEILEKSRTKLSFLVGTMIELPRAALVADKIARHADFFSFGTNDLTQTTFGLSRDDAGRFLPYYITRGILKEDPFQVLDMEGVGQLVEMGTERGRSVNKNLKVGICGEHGGEPSSIFFFHKTGLNYVSCSPFRVPIARLAAAHAALA
jgi:pyruvate,orthophosphate dikinase